MLQKASDFQLLRRGQWFDQLPPQLQLSLFEMSCSRQIKRGQSLFARGETPQGLYALVTGGLRVCSTQPDGKELLLIVIEPPSWIGEVAFFDGKQSAHDVLAEVDSRYLFFQKKALLRILEQKPAYWPYFAQLICQRMRLAMSVLEDLSLLPAPQRLARRLAAMSEGYQNLTPGTLCLKISQDQLAQMLAISRQTTNQLLKDLESQGIISLSYGRIVIRSLERLKVLQHE